jgi:archaellum biogenesis protein FlaJ (TadC family)
MPRRKRAVPQDPLVIGLSALIAVLLITSVSFNTPLISIVEPGGETTSLSFSMVGLPLLCLLILVIVLMKVKK